MNKTNEQNISLIEKVDNLYFNLEELFHELDETKKFELTPQVTKRLYNIITLYNDLKTELTKTYKIDLPRKTKDDPLTTMFSLIVDALTLVRSLYHGILNNSIDAETLSTLDNIMSRIERTILFSYYFKFIP